LKIALRNRGHFALKKKICLSNPFRIVSLFSFSKMNLILVNFQAVLIFGYFFIKKKVKEVQNTLSNIISLNKNANPD